MLPKENADDPNASMKEAYEHSLFPLAFWPFELEVFFMNILPPLSSLPSLYPNFSFFLSFLASKQKEKKTTRKQFQENLSKSLNFCRKKSVRNVKWKRFQWKIYEGGRAINNKSKWMQIKSNANKLQSN